MSREQQADEGATDMHYFGFCRLCGTGPLGLRKCGGCNSVVVLCDECDAVWTTADVTLPPQLTDDPTLPCPHCDASLVAAPSSWATREDIDATPWLRDALEAGEIELQTGKPFAPQGPQEPDEVEPTDEPLDAGA